MWLPYGVDADGTLIHIEDVSRGKTALGASLRQAAVQAEVSIGTVAKVKAMLEEAAR
jgi:hypothetical protein